MLSLEKRPLIFSEMIGQDKTVKEFKNRSKEIDFPSYMMFLGKSGSGKSTSAFIISKLLNCKNPVLNNEGYYDPCNKCDSCKDIIESRFNRDVLYFDASKMGVNEVKKLQEIVGRSPIRDENKIIIIDEAHLLNSSQARGGMLLISEKPRKNVYFILCTTDYSKFDQAFRTRFSISNFYSIAKRNVGKYLFRTIKSLVEENKLSIPEDKEDEFVNKVLYVLAENSDGSIRQGLQYLEKCIYGELWTIKETVEALNLLDIESNLQILYNILAGENILDVQTFLYESKDLSLFYYFTYKVLTNCLWMDLSNSMPFQYSNLTEEDYKKLKENKTYRELFEIYNQFKKESRYFDKNLFISYLLDFLNKNITIPKLSKTEKKEPPKRRTREKK